MLEHFFFAGSAEAPIAMVGLELLGEHALLRSLVVAPPARAAGVGSSLLDHAENYAKFRGVVALYLLTTTAEGFFGRRGFARTDRDSVPASIRSTREFAEFCPASSTIMVKSL